MAYRCAMAFRSSAADFADPIETESQSGQPDRARKLILVGNANVGKSLLFTRLTRRYVTVANYPGTTVEITTALADVAGHEREVIDTPGTGDLTPHSDDERVTRDVLLDNRDADIVLVGDIGNVRRTLLLALQLIEHELPFTLCLNMADEAKDPSGGLASLSQRLGVDVVITSALRGWNLGKLQRSAVAPRQGRVVVEYGDEIEAMLAAAQETGISRGEALSRLETEAAFAYRIARSRHALIERLLDGSACDDERRGVRAKLGQVTMHRIWGWPIVALVLYIGWLFVGKLGAGTFVDLVQSRLFERGINVWSIRLADLLLPFPHVHAIHNGVITAAYTIGAAAHSTSLVRIAHDLLVGPYGVITMALTYAIAIVLPVVMTFFFFFGLLEDSGYLPRLAVMLHRTFRRLGLNGKAVLPMVLGLGCDTMATLTTRILETKKERVIVTLLLALSIPCSAQLAVIIAMLAPLGGPAAAVWLSVMAGTVFLVGYLAAKIVPGESGDFILEIPPIRTPKISNILIKVAARTEWYLKEAVPLFIAGTVLLYTLDATHLLNAIQRGLAPLIVGGLGLPAEAANAFVIGFLRRDYGAAGLFTMQRAGHLTANQTVIALTVITLFIPCIANFFVMLKERGTGTAFALAAFIIVYSFGFGILMHAFFQLTGINLGS